MPRAQPRSRTRARGTPRTANNLLRWVRDYVQVKAEGKITAELADRALDHARDRSRRVRSMGQAHH